MIHVFIFPMELGVSEFVEGDKTLWLRDLEVMESCFIKVVTILKRKDESLEGCLSIV